MQYEWAGDSWIAMFRRAHWILLALKCLVTTDYIIFTLNAKIFIILSTRPTFLLWDTNYCLKCHSMPFIVLMYSGLVQHFNHTRFMHTEIVTKATAKYPVNKLHDLQPERCFLPLIVWNLWLISITCIVYILFPSMCNLEKKTMQLWNQVQDK